MTDLKHTKPTKLLWVDLEMTGLDTAKDVILEIAAEVTDFDFKILGSYEAVIKHPDEVLASMNDWCKQQHGASGLTERVRTNGRPEDEVRREFKEFIQQHFGDEPAILAGNSIHSDRGFIQARWPEVYELLHYRMLDVTAFKVLMQGKYGYEYQKQDVHRAFDDIHASIDELQDYLSRLRQAS